MFKKVICLLCILLLCANKTPSPPLFGIVTVFRRFRSTRARSMNISEEVEWETFPKCF